MIVLVGGQNVYLSDKRIKEYKEKFINNNQESNTKTVNADEFTDPEQFKKVLCSLDNFSIFNNKTLYFIKRLFANRYAAELLDSYLKKADLEKIEVVLWEPRKLDRRLKIYKTIAKIGKIEEYENLKEHEVRKWISDYVQLKNKSIDQRAITALLLKVGCDLLDLSNTLDKLLTAIQNTNKGTISKELVDELVELSVEASIWEFIDYLGDRNKNAIFKMLDRLVVDSKSYALTLGMVIRHLRLLALTIFYKQNGENLSGVSSRLKVNPYVARKLFQQANKFDWEFIKILIQKLFDADLAVKEGRFEEKLAFSLFISII